MGRDEDDDSHIKIMPGEDPDTDEERAGAKAHHCTDPLCFFVFLAALVPLGMITNYAFENGKIEKITHGYDYLGRLCGVDKGQYGNQGDPNATLGTQLYWCKKPMPAGVTPGAVGAPGATGTEETAAADVAASAAAMTMSLDLAHPVCVEKCPDEASGLAANAAYQLNCFESSEPGAMVPSADGNLVQEIVYKFRQEQYYSASDFAGRYCFPTDATLQKQLKDSLAQSQFTRWLVSLSGIYNASTQLIMVAVLAFILGFLYLFCVNWFARPIVYSCLFILSVFPLLAGGYLIYVSQEGGIDNMPNTGDSTYDLAAGISCLVLGLIFTLLSFCAGGAISRAIDCLQAACECIFAEKSLLIQPVLALIVYLGVFCTMLCGLLLLVSTGEVKSKSLQEFASVPLAPEISGITRSFTHTEDQYKMILYYLFMMFWMTELCNAFSQFVLAYAVQLWFFSPYESDGNKAAVNCPLIRGYWKGIRFHLGTLAVGSFLVAVLRIIRVILAKIAKEAEASGNGAASCMAKACMCCLACFESCVKFINKNAYMDVAINSTDFCHAAKNAMAIIAQEMVAMVVLNGAMWIFMIAGVGGITALGSFITWEACTNVSYLSDPTSNLYVADPMMVTIVGGGICAIIATAFMIVFDMVSDTMLYCFAIVSKNPHDFPEENTFIPNTLHANVQAAKNSSQPVDSDEDTS